MAHKPSKAAGSVTRVTMRQQVRSHLEGLGTRLIVLHTEVNMLYIPQHDVSHGPKPKTKPN